MASMRWICLFLPSLYCLALPPSEPEILFFNRIADFWEEGEYVFAKGQMEEFLFLYPESSLSSRIVAALGDLALREKEPEKALSLYSKINDPTIASLHFLHRLQCLYLLGWNAILADECEAYLDSQKEGLVEVLQYFLIALDREILKTEGESLKTTIASRILPYTASLIEATLHPEAALSLSHLFIHLKEFEKGATVCKKQGGERMVFESALIESKYAPSLAIETFRTLAKKEGLYQQEASYNLLTLLFEQGRYEEIIASQDLFLSQVREEQKETVRELLGKTFLLQAKIWIENKRSIEAMSILEKGEEFFLAPFEKGERFRLLALCQDDDKIYCDLTEQALSFFTKENGIDLTPLHIALFNRYIKMPEALDKSAEHLFLAFLSKAPIPKNNLLYLADYYRQQKGPLKERAFSLLQEILSQSPREEEAILWMGELYLEQGKREAALSLWEKELEIPSTSQARKEISLLLAKEYAAQNEIEKALSLFDALSQDKRDLKTKAGAEACLQSVRLREKKELIPFEDLLSQLKNLILQKNIENEPLYLEGALEYIALQEKRDPSLTKKLSLLEKTKKMFTSREDLLSRDYHDKKEKDPTKEALFQKYMDLLDAQILKTEEQIDASLCR